MSKTDPRIQATKPTNIFVRPLEADFKALFKALAKGVGDAVAGHWTKLGVDAVEALSAIGLTTEPGELAFLLIRRSITRALFDLVGESASQSLADVKADEAAFVEQLDFSISFREVRIDKEFLDRPTDLPLVHDLQNLLARWLEQHGIAKVTAKAISDRFSTYFVYSLNEEWRKNVKCYGPLLESIDTPFSKAGDREWAWAAYSALLQRKINEGIFDEPFSLSQIFVPPNAYYTEEVNEKDPTDNINPTRKREKRIVVSLQEELIQWLQARDGTDTIRVISGGPGSGKSSFARIFAAQVARSATHKVLFVPLHLIDPSRDLVDEIGNFIKDEGVLTQNPLDPQSPEPNLLIIFDGLDELASQGKAAAETARSFVREVEKTVEKRNLQSLKLRVLISGRELIVQENQSEFRKPGQVLSLLPYYVPKPTEEEGTRIPESDAHQLYADGELYEDQRRLLKKDLREVWWKNYGTLCGKNYDGLPRQLRRRDLDEITAQPLLNYLIALSLTREKVDFTKEVNINSIYEDLVAAVHERGYEKRRQYVRQMSVEEFSRVLEEIGLAAWHGDGRTTTVREIQQHCDASGVGRLLERFREGAEAGVTRLLAAFFFRQHGQRASGDPTFVFTHKSFGEYLAAKRITRALERITTELEARSNSPDSGWDARDALKHWAQICGPSPISEYLFTFLCNEVRLRSKARVQQIHGRLAELFNQVLLGGMPMEQLQFSSFRRASFQARNSEESLLVALNACARADESTSNISCPDPTSFGSWFRRIQGQRSGPGSCLAARCLSYLDLTGSQLYIADLYGSNFGCSILRNLRAAFATFSRSNMVGADLRGGELNGAQFQETVLIRADIRNAFLVGANLREANLERAKLSGSRLQNADMRGAHLEATEIKGADLILADLRNAVLRETDLKGSNLSGADLRGADLREADLTGANLENADLTGAKVTRTRMKGANLRGARVSESGLSPETSGDQPRKARRTTAKSELVEQQIQDVQSSPPK